MRQISFSILLLLFVVSIQSQESTQSYKFRIYLKDKGLTDYTISEPERFLSKQSIQRKINQGIVVDETDLPISSDYFNLISLAGGKVVSHSKWFNTIVVQLNDSSKINNFLNLSFVDSAKYVWRGSEAILNKAMRPRLSFTDFSLSHKLDNWGQSEAQFEMHNATKMYKSTFAGRGINVAIIDAGFTNVDVIPYFMANNIVEYKSFVPDGEVMVDSDHGTRVFSTISGLVPGKILGSATGANFYLFQSEEVATEFPIEEDYWVRAVEYADSVGVDVINSSLGYNSFDDNQLNYSHEHLDGRSSIMTLAADMAYAKGMIVVTSAGNEGSKPWQKISVPGDATNALTVGAVGIDSIIAPFSSKGFTADNRIKPDVVSVGSGTITIGRTGDIEPSNGTSFSAPFMAGMVATLWSINPDINRSDLLDIIRQSSDRYHNPDSVYGNGIPNIGIAMAKVLESLPIHHDKYIDANFEIVKNDDSSSFEITLVDPKFDANLHYVTLLDENGDILMQQLMKESKQRMMMGDELNGKNKSLYIVITAPDKQKTIRFKL